MKAKQTKKGKRRATIVALPSSTMVVVTTMITRVSLGPRKETFSTSVTSNKNSKEEKNNVASLEKGL